MKRCLGRVVHAALVAILLAACAPAWGQTTYCVATNGSDANSGADWSQPFKTITNAIRIAQSGDTILATNGTYTYGDATAGKAITVTNGITVRSMNGYAVTIIKPGAGPARVDGVVMDHANAVFDGFRITAVYGSGINMKTGLVQNCWIDTCNASKGGGVVFGSGKDAATAYKATVRNCMIVGNSAGAAAGVYFSADYAGIVDSCTIVKNTAGADGKGVGGVYQDRWGNTGGTIRNSIVHGNTSGGTVQNFSFGAKSTDTNIFNNCITVDYTTGGSGNTTNDPSFLNWTAGDYHLSPNSPCRDKGSIQAWMAGTTDLGGVVARIMPIVNGTNDMGCFEFDTDALLCSISATPLYGFPPLPVTFTSSVSGDTNGLFYRWDLRADGSFEVEGADKAGFTTNLDIGLYSIALTITNAAGQTASTTNLNYVKVGPPTNYVDAAGASPLSPYTNWATASTNIQKALDLGVPGTLTLVTNGIYNTTNNCITNDMGVTLRSMNGYAYTTIRNLAVTNNTGPGILRIDHASAVVDGFTLTSKNGTPVTLVNGLLQNCWLTANYTYRPGGVALYNGIVRNCLISSNQVTDTTGIGGVQFNSTTGLVENCTITRNSGASSSCSGVNNGSDGGIIRNSIVHDNTGGANSYQLYFLNKAGIINCCITTNYLTGTSPSYVTNSALGSGSISNDPQFVNGPGADYRLSQGSPCINKGTNQDWMVGVKDWAGNPRILHTVDMGIYEWIPPRGTIIMLR